MFAAAFSYAVKVYCGRTANASVHGEGSWFTVENRRLIEKMAGSGSMSVIGILQQLGAYDRTHNQKTKLFRVGTGAIGEGRCRGNEVGTLPCQERKNQWSEQM
jgi:hypothetical protein